MDLNRINWSGLWGSQTDKCPASVVRTIDLIFINELAGIRRFGLHELQQGVDGDTEMW